MSIERQESKLIRNLGFWDLMAIAIGQIIGAGIMSSTGVAIGMTGTGVVLAFLLSPFLTIISIFPIAILSSVVPTTGGPYRYCSRLMGKIPGMVYLLLYTITCAIGVSQFALSFGMYFESIVPIFSQHTAAMIILTLFYIVNLRGVKTAAFLNKVMTVILFGGLLLFIGFGVPKVDISYVLNSKNLFMNGSFAFISTLALLSSATAGAQYVAELGGEAKDAGRTIPKAMVISTFVAGIFYVFIALVASGVLPIEKVMNQPLTLVAKYTMPIATFYIFVIGAALGSTATTLNSTLSCITKPLLVACDDEMLPKSMGTVSDKGVPYKLLTFYYLSGMIPLLLKYDISFITKFTTANSLLNKLMVCFALFVLATKFGDLLKYSTLKLSPLTCKMMSIAGVIILCVLSYSLFMNLSLGVVVFLLILLIGVILYVLIFTKDKKIENDLFDYTSNKY